MRNLTKDELTIIVKTYKHLTDRAYSDDFCWDADVGRVVSPLGFAAYVAVYGDNLATDLQKEAEHHANELFDAFPHETRNRKSGDVVNDILRNIAHHAIDELEGYYHGTGKDEGVES